MAIDATILSAAKAAIAAAAVATTEVDAYLENLVALNQLNAEVIAELNALHSTGGL